MTKTSRSKFKRYEFVSQLPNWISKGLTSDTIKEAAIPLISKSKTNRHFQAIEFYNHAKGTPSYPLTAVDIIANSYLRLSYQKPDGSSATLGSSLVGAISFRTADNSLNFIPQIKSASFEVTEEEMPLVTLVGNYGDIAQIHMIRKYLTPSDLGTTCYVEVSFKAKRDIHLAPDLLGNDTFRFLTISSMYTTQRYDGNRIEYSDYNSELKTKNIDEEIKRGNYIFQSVPTTSSMLSVSKDLASKGDLGTPGAKDSPSLHISFDQRQYLLGVQGYLAPTLDINSDSLSVWLEWKDAPVVIREGEIISFSYAVTAQGGGM